MKISDIKKIPVVHANIHESVYKSFQTLDLVKGMLGRGDSRESIINVIELIYEND